MKQGQHINHNHSLISSSLEVNRRDFLNKIGLLGGGIIIYSTMGDSLSFAAEGPMSRSNTPTDFNAFLRIGIDERIALFIGKVDMGQGTYTSFPQIVAEELDVAYDSIDLLMGDTDLCPYDFGTVGSMAIRMHGVLVRNAACEAKGVLKELAADYLNCHVDNLHTKNGVVFDKTNTDKKVTYGTLTKGKIIEKHLQELPPLKDPSEFTVMGKPYFHQDAHDKVTGVDKNGYDGR